MLRGSARQRALVIGGEAFAVAAQPAQPHQQSRGPAASRDWRRRMRSSASIAAAGPTSSSIAATSPSRTSPSFGARRRAARTGRRTAARPRDAARAQRVGDQRVAGRQPRRLRSSVATAGARSSSWRWSRPAPATAARRPGWSAAPPRAAAAPSASRPWRSASRRGIVGRRRHPPDRPGAMARARSLTAPPRRRRRCAA